MKMLSHLPLRKPIAYLALLLTIAFSVNSCRKETTRKAEPVNSIIETKNLESPANVNSAAYRVPAYCADLQNPCADPACRPFYNCFPQPDPILTPQIHLENFFSTYDQNILTNPDSLIVKDYMISKNRELIEILCTYFPSTYKRSELNPVDTMITYAGLIHMLAEGNGHFSSPSSATARKAPDFSCVKDVILGVFDVASLIEDYVHLIQSGGTWTTVRGLLFRTLKRYGGWLTVASVVYDISTTCI